MCSVESQLVDLTGRPPLPPGSVVDSTEQESVVEVELKQHELFAEAAAEVEVESEVAVLQLYDVDSILFVVEPEVEAAGLSVAVVVEQADVVVVEEVDVAE